MTSLPIASRVKRIKPSPSSVASAQARDLRAAGRNIVDLTIGEPDFRTPDNISLAGIKAIVEGNTRYTSVNGTPALRTAILVKFKDRLGITYGENQIALGGGAKQIIFLALMATVENASEVIVPAPYWVSYPDMVLANDGTPVIIDCPAEAGFKLQPSDLEKAITDRTLWVILNAPGNPTGAIYTESELNALAGVVRRHPHVHVLSDEIYDEIVFDGKPIKSLVTVAPDLADRIFVVNGVSKTYAMTGWRIGYGLGNPVLVAAINKLQSQMSSCPSSISQAAAVEALTGDQQAIANMRAVYEHRRDLAISLLQNVPQLSCKTSDGAFYIFSGCKGVIGQRTPQGNVIETDQDFALYLLNEEGVAVMHGGAYGMSPFFRISIATSDEVIREACERIAKACSKLTP